MVNFGPLAAEIGSRVWGTPATFNGFRVLAALLHGTLYSSGRQPNFLALNRVCHLSAGRPSRWALARVLVTCVLAGDGVQGSYTQCRLGSVTCRRQPPSSSSAALPSTALTRLELR